MKSKLPLHVYCIAYLAICLLLFSSCQKDGISIQTHLQPYAGTLQINFLPQSIEKVFSAAMPWEAKSLNHFNVIKNDSTYSMWYDAFGASQIDFDGYFCLAVSKDGANWSRPAISNNSNILLSGYNSTGVGGTYVFIDKDDKVNPYKMICIKLVGSSQKTFLYLSPDGIHWKESRMLYNEMQDTQFGVINFDKFYYVFSRYNDYSNGFQRAIGLSILDTNLNTIQQPLLLLKADINSSFPHIYNNAASKINDSTVLLFPTYYNDNNGNIDIKLLYTNNLKDYYLVNDNINNYLFPDGDVNWAIVSPGVIPTGEENTYWLYYFGTRFKHNDFIYSPNYDVSYYRIKLVIK